MALNMESVGEVAESESRYNWRDVALYALSLGAGTGDLRYVLDEPAPEVLPTFPVLSAFEPVFQVMGRSGCRIVQVLHTSQCTELIKPYPPSGTVRTRATLVGLWDMKIGALGRVETEAYVDGELRARTMWELLVRGEGGFGGARPPKRPKVRVPKDAVPAFEVEVPTAPHQALLYRLNGDTNPIHSNPEVAKEAGLDAPILHGLCTYGIGARVALRELAGDDPGRFKSFEARFSKMVLPGQTLVVSGYALPEPGLAAVSVRVKETGEDAIGAARFEFTP